MSKTDVEVITRALRNINVVAIGSVASGDEYDLASSEYDALHDELISDLKDKYGLRGASWSKSAVPDNLFASISKMLSLRLTSVFPVGAAVMQRTTMAESDAMTSIVKILKKPKRGFKRYPSELKTVYNNQ